MPSKNQNVPLNDDDIAELADLIDDAAARTDAPLSLEGVDGFVTALQCAPRPIAAESYLPVLFEHDAPATLFADAVQYGRFEALLGRRWNEIARALAAPIPDRQPGRPARAVPAHHGLGRPAGRPAEKRGRRAQGRWRPASC